MGACGLVCGEKLLAIPRKTRELLGIKLDDQLLVEIEINVLSCGKAYYLGGHRLCLNLKPLGSGVRPILIRIPFWSC